MEQQKENWIRTLLSFAGPCKGKMILSVFCAILSVGGGFVPFWAVYEILILFIDQTVTLSAIQFWCLVGVAGYLVRVVCFGVSTILAHISAYTILEGLRLKIADRLMRAPLGEVMGRRIGYLKNIIMDKVDDIEPPLAHMIPELTSNLLLPLAIFVWMLVIDWRLGLSVLIAPILSMIPMAFLMRNYNSQYAAYMEANNHVNSVIIEYVEGIEVVKAFNQSTSSYEKFVGAVESFKGFTLDWFRSTWKTMNLMLAIMPTTLVGVLPVGLLLNRAGQITPAELAMGIILSLSIVGPLMKVTIFINEAKSMEYAVEAANELQNLPVLPDSGKMVSLRRTDIVLQDVSFSYGMNGSEENDVLHRINLTMPEGSFTALVGPSGGGKSTIARLIARFWDVTGGSISIGGRNIKELSIRQLSELVSFVTQDNFLFNCSLKENIRLGNPNATDAEVFAAARAACCDEFIARLEKGYDTSAGDAGKRLSGGEKQRIAIARAILKNAPIVILDEATAFTDPQNEDKIQKSIMALSQGKTLLVIAHRLSTIQNADQIVVLQKGQIVDCGKQEELLARCPLYADLWQAHIGAKNWSVGEKKEGTVNV
ncbi:MAG: ABC transporter ATP-binding protein [Peptococcaceae bacterium]|nr:ABC transporter ATP-binding protein [Peptococcaceae bacterium]